MANVHLKEDSYRRAYIDGERAEQGRSVILDFNGKPISSTEMQGEREEQKAREQSFAYMYPVGKGYRYFKIKCQTPKGEFWRASYVYNRPIPKNSYPIHVKEAIEIQHGANAVIQNEAKYKWDTINDGNVGHVTVRVEKNPGTEFIKPDAEGELDKYLKQAQQFKL